MGILFDPDHMSAAGQRQALDLVEDELIPEEHRAAEAEGRAPRIPGLISSHSWADDVTYQRILNLGGQVAPMQADASSFVDRWAERRQWANDLAPDDVLYGMGYGADTNGFASQPGPRPDPVNPRQYTGEGWQAPIGGVSLYQQTSGLQSYDVTTDGVAHDGLYADWYRELALAADEQYPELGGGEAIMADMLNGSENFLQMWERASYGGNDCVTEPVDVVFDEDGRAERVQDNDGSVTPDETPTVTGSVGAGDGHVHASAVLPATGGGMAGGGLLLLGLTLAGAGVFGRRRDA